MQGSTAPSLALLLSCWALVSAPAHAQSSLHATCLPGVQDAALPGECIPASSVPAPGALLPLGPELFVLPTGEVGIGTMTPEHRLDVAGDLRAVRCAAGNLGSFGPLNGWNWLYDFTAEVSDFTSIHTLDGLSSYLWLDPDHDLTGPNATDVFGTDFEVFTKAGNDKDIQQVHGPFGLVQHFGTGTVEFLIGTESIAWSNAGQVQRQIGAFLDSRASGATLVTENAAAECRSGNDGAGTVQNDYGLRIWTPQTVGPVVNHYGLYLEDQDYGAQDRYAIYSDGGTTFLRGDLGVGTDTPSAKLHVDGDFVATGTKSFVEPHPLDPQKEIRFVCLEGNEAGTYFRGTARLRDGVAWIAVPEEFALVTEPAGLTVQVTPLEGGGDLFVARKGLEWIEVHGARDIEFDYFVNGVRHGYADFAVVRDRRTGPSAASQRDADDRAARGLDREAQAAPRRPR